MRKRSLTTGSKEPIIKRPGAGRSKRLAGPHTSNEQLADACEAAANIVAQATTNERLRECLMEAARRLRGLI